MTVVNKWASNANYGAGHGSYTGTPSKVAPSAPVVADGFVPADPLAAQHLNHELNKHAYAINGAKDQPNFRRVQALAIGFNTSAARFRGTDVVANTASAYRITSSTYNPIVGTPSGLTNTYGLASNNNVLIAVGTGAGNVAVQSSGDLGATWTTRHVGGAGNVALHVVFDSVNARFITANGVTAPGAYYSNDGLTWNNGSGSTMSSVVDGLVTANGITLRNYTYVSFDVTSDGINWSAGPAVVSSSNRKLLGLGWSDLHQKFVAVFQDTSGGAIEVLSSADPVNDSTWTVESTTSNGSSNLFITNFTPATSNWGNRAVVTPSGALYVAGPTTGAKQLHGLARSFDLGSTWETLTVCDSNGSVQDMALKNVGDLLYYQGYDGTAAATQLFVGTW